MILTGQIEVAGFPTLFFLPGKSKNTPIQYEGAREVDDLLSFIMEKVRAARCGGR